MTEQKTLIATSFASTDEVLAPRQVWSSQAFTLTDFEALSLSVMDETHTVKEWSYSCANSLVRLNNELQDVDVVGGCFIAPNKLDFIIISFYAKYDTFVYTKAKECLPGLAVELPDRTGMPEADA